ncbi:helix-turn-helix domain-containing protein [Terrarubrum flagellatum]|uniref:TetR/AcrR family transcriptional regulator n=1 Tax=Terrirubrum flagellatum TaxID=2895980 RepID=UPI003144E45E
MMGEAIKGPKRSRLSGDERRRRLLDVATDAFARNGYQAASMREIAAAAGVTKPVLYDHFPSKEALFIELVRRARDDLVARGAAAMATADSLDRRLRAAVDAFFLFAEEQPARARVLISTPKGVPELHEAVTAIQDEATRALAALLIAEHDLLPEAPDRSQRLLLTMEFLKAGMHGLAEWWVRHPDVPRAILTETVLTAAWSGLRNQMRKEN